MRPRRPPPARPRPERRSLTALVLSGGGARGAYEAGVVRYLREALPDALGRQPRIDLLCGTSIGAVNACYLAASAHVPEAQGARLANVWLSLKLEKVYRWSALGVRGLPGYFLQQWRTMRRRTSPWRLPDLLAPVVLARIVRERIDWGRLHENVRSGALEAITVTATDLGTGRSVVFVETAGELPAWGHDPVVEARRARLGPEHALASGAIPLLFHPVRIDGGWFSDGSVRQTTPLAPAIRLGADRVLVVSLRPTVPAPPAPLPSDEAPSSAAQLGRVLSALMLDRTDADLDRMRRLNRVLEEGERAFGAGFEDRLAALSAQAGAPIRRVRDLVLRPEVDLSEVARDHASKRLRRVAPGTIAARLLARVAADANAAADGAADLASYLLFDREYAGELIALGYQDAARQRDALVAFFGAPAEGASARSA